jgi:hypothetical protein
MPRLRDLAREGFQYPGLALLVNCSQHAQHPVEQVPAPPEDSGIQWNCQVTQKLWRFDSRPQLPSNSV